MANSDFPIVNKLRDDVQALRNRYNNSKTYDNALALQKAERELAATIMGERKSWLVIDGESGDHDLTPEQIAVSALWEIYNTSEDKLYPHRVAKQALITLGELSETDI